MAHRSLALSTNAPGPYFVDESCIDCDLCRTLAPTVFTRDDRLGLSIVHRQPTTPGQTTLAEEARLSCPCDSIGSDVVPFISPPSTFPAE